MKLNLKRGLAPLFLCDKENKKDKKEKKSLPERKKDIHLAIIN